MAWGNLNFLLFVRSINLISFSQNSLLLRPPGSPQSAGLPSRNNLILRSVFVSSFNMVLCYLSYIIYFIYGCAPGDNINVFNYQMLYPFESRAPLVANCSRVLLRPAYSPVALVPRRSAEHLLS